MGNTEVKDYCDVPNDLKGIEGTGKIDIGEKFSNLTKNLDSGLKKLGVGNEGDKFKQELEDSIGSKKTKLEKEVNSLQAAREEKSKIGDLETQQSNLLKSFNTTIESINSWTGDIRSDNSEVQKKIDTVNKNNELIDRKTNEKGFSREDFDLLRKLVSGTIVNENTNGNQMEFENKNGDIITMPQGLYEKARSMLSITSRSGETSYTIKGDFSEWYNSINTGFRDNETLKSQIIASERSDYDSKRRNLESQISTINTNFNKLESSVNKSISNLTQLSCFLGNEKELDRLIDKDGDGWLGGYAFGIGNNDKIGINLNDNQQRQEAVSHIISGISDIGGFEQYIKGLDKVEVNSGVNTNGINSNNISGPEERSVKERYTDTLGKRDQQIYDSIHGKASSQPDPTDLLNHLPDSGNSDSTIRVLGQEAINAGKLHESTVDKALRESGVNIPGK